MPAPRLPFGLTDSEWDQIEAALAARHVPPALRSELRAKLSGRYDGLLLYGSWARGDADGDSDLDTLVLNFRGIRPSRGGRVSVADYDDTSLCDVNKTLFGFHLVRDGLILFDPASRLAEILAGIEAPLPGAVIDRVRSLTPVLDISNKDLDRYIEGLGQVARYLLRSALYAEALDAGEPCFSVREIADRKSDPDLATVLSSHETVRPTASPAVFHDLTARLASVIGPLLPNPYGDLHGLIEGSWKHERELSNFATLALSDGRDELPYDELPKVTL